MKTNKRRYKDQPLKVRVFDGKLVISIGTETLAFADSDRRNNETDRTYHVTDPDHFAVDVTREMEREDEIGASPLTDFLDKMMDYALEQGSAAVKYD
jgi:hypothetical protein